MTQQQKDEILALAEKTAQTRGQRQGESEAPETGLPVVIKRHSTRAVRKQKSCQSKTRYESKVEVQRAIKRLMKEGKRRMQHDRPIGMRCYSCPNCHGWHIAHVEPSQARTRRPLPIIGGDVR